MFGMKKKQTEKSRPFLQQIEIFQHKGILKEGKIRILRITTGYEKSRKDNTKCDIAEFRCGKDAEIYGLVIFYHDNGKKEIQLLKNIHFAVRPNGERFWYLDEYLKMYVCIGQEIIDN